MGTNIIAVFALLKQRRQWHPTPVLLPGKSHGRRSLEGCSPWGRYESDMTERLHFHCSLSCTGEGNGDPLQCSCLENPRDGEAWSAAICGVTQSRTRLKRLSSSSSRRRGNLLRKGNLCFGSTYTDSMDASLSELQELLMDREAWRAVMGLQRVRHD